MSPGFYLCQVYSVILEACQLQFGFRPQSLPLILPYQVSGIRLQFLKNPLNLTNYYYILVLQWLFVTHYNYLSFSGGSSKNSIKNTDIKKRTLHRRWAAAGRPLDDHDFTLCLSTFGDDAASNIVDFQPPGVSCITSWTLANTPPVHRLSSPRKRRITLQSCAASAAKDDGR